MKPNQIGYIKAQSNNATTIEIESVIDFYKYVILQTVTSHSSISPVSLYIRLSLQNIALLYK